VQPPPVTLHEPSGSMVALLVHAAATIPVGSVNIIGLLLAYA
jgi:hypothetical protein